MPSRQKHSIAAEVESDQGDLRETSEEPGKLHTAEHRPQSIGRTTDWPNAWQAQRETEVCFHKKSAAET